MVRRTPSAAPLRLVSRTLEREWLDDLSPDDPRAVHSRRDLKRINAWMLHVGIMRRMLSTHSTGRVPRSLLEIGGGDGSFLLRLAKRLACEWPELEVTLVDRVHTVGKETVAALAALGWNLEFVEADVFDLLARDALVPADVAIANLVLHHFEDAALERLFAGLAERTTLFAACEPRRSPLALGASRMLWALGCNDVSRHDAALSVKAGFRDGELSALWPASGCWALEERSAGLFSHAFAAQRLEA